MSFLEQFRKTLVLLTELLIISAVVFAFVFTWIRYYPQSLYLGDGNFLFVFAYIALLLLFGYLFRAFKLGMLRVHELIYSLSLSGIFSNFIMYLIICLVARIILSPIPMIVLTGYQIAIFWIGTIAANKVYYSVYDPRRIVAVFNKGTNAGDIIRKMRGIPERYIIEKGITTDCPLEEIKAEIDKYEAVLICDCTKDIKDAIFNYCYKKGKRMYIQPSPSEIIINNTYQNQISDSPILVCRNRGFSKEQRIVKRIGDFLISGVALILLGPVMLGVAVAIRAYDGGPVFYKQRRLTENGREFDVIKFRSMIVNAEKSGAQLAQVKDSRITPVGKFIRMVRLDELPQLINILKGDMSIVGPRPERPEIMAEYIEKFPEFEYRLKAKAGLTGYAQVFGKYNTTPMDKLNMDLCYIEKHSLLLDIKIMVMTVKILFMKESTEGTEAGRPKMNKN